MGTRGRTSMASLSVIHSPIESGSRLEPPEELTKEERKEWVAIVNTMNTDHFMRGNSSLLAQLCRHIIASNRIASLIEDHWNGDKIMPKAFIALLKRQEAESKIINALMRSMRLTQRSVGAAATAKHPKQTSKLWEKRKTS